MYVSKSRMYLGKYVLMFVSMLGHFQQLRTSLLFYIGINYLRKKRAFLMVCWRLFPGNFAKVYGKGKISGKGKVSGPSKMP